MSDDGPVLRALLERKVREAGREAAAADGELPADRIAALDRLAKLVELRDRALPARPPRWRIAVVLAATLVLVSMLLFLRVGETEVEMQLVVSEAGFVLARPQTVTGIVNLSELGASHLRRIELSGPELSAWSAEPADEQKAVRLAALDGGTLTLDPLALPGGAEVRVDAERSPAGYRIELQRASAVVRATAHGTLRVDLLGKGTHTATLPIPRPLLLETDPGEVALDLGFPKNPDTALFSPQLAVRNLALSRVDEYDAPGERPRKRCRRSCPGRSTSNR